MTFQKKLFDLKKSFFGIYQIRKAFSAATGPPGSNDASVAAVAEACAIFDFLRQIFSNFLIGANFSFKIFEFQNCA